MSLARKLRRLREKKEGGAARKRPRKALLESLEPRILLSAELSYSLSGGVQDLILSFDDASDQVSLTDGSTTNSVAFDNGDGIVNVELSGTSGSDMVNLDFSGLDVLAEHVSLTFNALNILLDGGDGADSLSILDHDSSGTGLEIDGVDLSVQADAITVASGYTIAADDISLTASATDDGNPVDLLDPLLGSISFLNLTDRLGVDEFLFADIDATLDVTGAVLSGTNISLKAEADLDLNPTGFDISGVKLSAVYAGSRARVIADDTTITATGDVDISATSDVAASAIVGAGSSASASADNAVAVAVVDSEAVARISGASQITAAGHLNLSALNRVTASAVADASGGSGTFGGTLALTLVDQTTRAFIDGTAVVDDLTDTDEADSVKVSAAAEGTATTIAKSSPGGAEESASGDTDTERQLTRTGAGTSEGDVNVAAAVAITHFTSDTQAYVSTEAGSVLVTDGDIDITADSANRGRATADGTATEGIDTGVGVAVGLNFADIDSDAYIGGTADFTADAVTAKATIDGREWGFDPSETVSDANEAAKTFDPSSAVNTSDETISITDHGFSTGDVVKYETGGATDTPIKNLSNGGVYFVIRVDENTVKLAKSYADATASTPAPIDLDTGATGTDHKLTRFHETIDLGLAHGFQTGDAVIYSAGEGETAIGGLTDGDTYYIIAVDPLKWGFDPSTAVDTSENVETIDLGVNHGLKTGSRVIYDNGGGGNIDGLTDGTTYYVIAVEGEPTKLKLATTASNAEAGEAINLNSTGSGDYHTLTQAEPTKVRLASSKDNAKNGIAIDLTASSATGDAHTLTEKASSFIAEAASGAGASDIGVAGALALNLITTNAEAYVASGATVDLHGASLTLEAPSKTQITAKASPNEAASGDTVGIGASVALNIGDNVVKAEIGGETTDPVAAGAIVTNAADITLSAKGSHKMTTQAKGGAEGGVAITPVVAISLANNDTLAQIGTGSGDLSLTGALEVSADHSSSTSTKAEGDTTSTDTAAIGASLALTLLGDRAVATTARSITAGGDVAFTAKASGTSKSDAKASAKGGRTDSERSEDTNPDHPDTVDQEADGQRTGADDRAASGGARGSGDRGDTPSASSSDGPVTVAAAIGINLADSIATASIPDGITIDAGSALSLSTTNDTSAYALADGSATKGDVGVGVAVAVNKADIINEATIGDAAIQAEGISIQARETTTEFEFNSATDVDDTRTEKTFDPTSGGVVDAAQDTITITGHGFSTGDVVEYKTGSDADKAIGNLKSGTVYYVIRKDDNTVQLAKSYENAQSGTAIDINTDEAPTGTAHKLIHFNETIDLGEDHGLSTGDLVLYRKGENDAVGGLTDGEVYYVVVDDTDSSKVRLAKSTADASAMKVVDLTDAETGSTHKLIRLSTTMAEATSGAGAKDVGVAGSLGLNIVDKNVAALIQTGASVDAGGGDVALSAENAGVNVAVANSTVSGKSDVGVGLSVALNIIDTATTAEIQDAAALTNAADLGITAATSPTTRTVAQAGATSDVAVGGAVAITLADAITTARLGTGSATTIGGEVTIDAAEENGTVYTTADGEVAGKDVGVGAAIAIAITDDEAFATSGRVLTANGTGASKIEATTVARVETIAKAGAMGVKSENTSGSSANEQTDTQRSHGTSTASDAGSSAGRGQDAGDTTDASTSDGAVGIAAAVAVNTSDVTAQAAVLDDLTAAGALTIHSGANADVSAKTDGRAAAAQITFDPSATGVVDTDEDALYLENHKLRTGDAVKYSNDGGSDIGGLTNNTTYYVIKVDDDHVKLSDTKEHAEAGTGIRDLSSNGSGTKHKLAIGEDGLDVGVGAAVSVNLADLTNTAYVAAGTAVNAAGLTVNADMAARDGEADPQTHSFGAEAVSGAGAKDVGVAGSVSINIVDAYTKAEIRAGAAVGIDNGALAVGAAATTESTTTAKPAGGGASADVGVGASVSVAVIDNVTWAKMEDTAHLAGYDGGKPTDVNVEAVGHYTTITEASNGASGDDVAIAAGVSVAVVDNETTARIGTDAGFTLPFTGNAQIRADHISDTTTKADAEVAGDVAVGVSVGVAVVDETVEATLARNLGVESDSNGSVTVSSKADVASTIEVKASAGGTDSSGSNSDDEAGSQTNNPNVTREEGSQSLPSAQTESSSASSEAEGSSGTGSSGVGVAAAVAVNVVDVSNTARIVSGADVYADGAVTVSAEAEVDATAKAVGSAISLESESNNVAAAVGLNVAKIQNRAFVDSGSTVQGAGITIEAVVPGDAVDEFIVWGAAAGGGQGDAGVAGSVGINVIKIETEAGARSGSVLKSTGNLTVDAETDLGLQNLAVAAGFSTGEAAVGAAVAVNVVKGIAEDAPMSTTAYIAGTADATGAMSISAETDLAPINFSKNILGYDLSIDLTAVAIAGGATAGEVGVGAAAVVNVFDVTTLAYIGDGAQINQDAGFGPKGSVSLNAVSDTEVFDLAGSLGVSLGAAGVGVGLDVTLIDKDTRAYIGSGAQVTSGGGITVDADSSEDLLSVVANAGVSETAGVAASVSVQVIDTTTRAYIADSLPATPADVDAAGNVSVTADGHFSSTMIAGAIGAAGTAGVGLSATTLVHTDTVQAFVGENAVVATGGAVGLTVAADSNEDIISIGPAGGGGGHGGRQYPR